MTYHYFHPYIMKMKDLEILYKMFELVDRIGLADDESKALMLERYIRTESMWDDIRQETDYDDFH